MREPDFDRCTTAATDLLIKQNLRDRILNIRNLNYDKNIFFDSIQNYALTVKCPLSKFFSDDNDSLKDGCTLILGNNNYVVLYNEEIRYFEHLNWTLAHEIGHIYLNHKDDGPIEEVEAHFFAAQLLMPEYTIYKMSEEHGKICKKDLEEIFGVSPEAAQKRLDTMKKKNSFFCGEKHNKIWQMQKERIDLYYECGKDRVAFRNCLEFKLYYEEEYKSYLEYAFA